MFSEDPSLPERMCSIMGPKNGVDQAIQKIHEIIQNVQERDNGMGPMGGEPTVNFIAKRTIHSKIFC